MKLELKHVQHYPMGENGLKFKWDDSNELWGIHYESETDFDKMLYPISTLIFTIENQSEEKLGWKLALHPLYDLTKEIEVNGEKFVPMEILWKDEYFMTEFDDEPKDYANEFITRDDRLDLAYPLEFWQNYSNGILTYSD